MWKIYYSDGKTISSADVSPFAIERRNAVQVIIQDSQDHNWVTVVGDHFYVWDDRGCGSKWWGCERFALFDYLLKPGFKCVLFGETVDNETFKKVFEMARNDEDFNQPKEIFMRNERHP